MGYAIGDCAAHTAVTPPVTTRAGNLGPGRRYRLGPGERVGEPGRGPWRQARGSRSAGEGRGLVANTIRVGRRSAQRVSARGTWHPGRQGIADCMPGAARAIVTPLRQLGEQCSSSAPCVAGTCPARPARARIAATRRTTPGSGTPAGRFWREPRDWCASERPTAQRPADGVPRWFSMKRCGFWLAANTRSLACATVRSLSHCATCVAFVR